MTGDGTPASRSGRAFFVVAAACSGVVALTSQTMGQMTIRNLGNWVDQNQHAWTYAVSADGSAVSGQGEYPGRGMRAFRWTLSDGLQELGTLGGFLSRGAAISADGSTVVGHSEISPNGLAHAFRWTSEGMEDLGVFPGGGQQSRAFAVSGDGSVVVGASDTATYTRAFKWTRETGLVELVGYGRGSGAQGINADGTVVVGSASFSSGAIRAVRWTSAGIYPLGSLGGNSFAYAVNGNGSVVVGYSEIPGQPRHAFRWTPSGMVDLGALGDRESFAYGTNTRGSMVVGSSLAWTGDPGRAFLWTSNLGMVDLNEYLPSLGLDLTGWVLADARDINDRGDITGWGFFNNLSRPYLITGVPEPVDFNRDGAIGSQDFFDFLSAFFAGEPAADFNRDSTINSQDFFSFLTTFLQG